MPNNSHAGQSNENKDRSNINEKPTDFMSPQDIEDFKDIQDFINSVNTDLSDIDSGRFDSSRFKGNPENLQINEDLEVIPAFIEEEAEKTDEKVERETRSSKARRSKYRRSSRLKNLEVEADEDDIVGSEEENTSKTTMKEKKVRTSSKNKHILLNIMSIVVLTVLLLTLKSLPLGNGYSKGRVSENIYSGFAMRNGQVPYDDFFTNDGSLLYEINKLGNLGGTTWLLWIFEALALLVTFVLVRKFTSRKTENKNLIAVISVASILSLGVLIFGGSNSVLFTLPFLMWIILFLDDVFNKDVKFKDEKYILLGLTSSIVFLISPSLLFLPILIFGVLTVKSVREKEIARGFYRFLAAIFGALLVIYPTLYSGLLNEYANQAYEQMFVLPLASFTIFGAYKRALVVILIALGLWGNFAWRSRGKENSNGYFSTILLISAAIYLILTMGTPLYGYYEIALVFPFFLPFIVARMNALESTGKDIGVLAYLKSSFYMPVFIIVTLFALNAYTAFSERGIAKEEKEIAAYIKNNSNASDRIFTVTGDHNIYNKSERLAIVGAAPRNYPAYYHNNFDREIKKSLSKFIVVAKDRKITDSLKQSINADYVKSDKSTDNFTLYKKKDDGKKSKKDDKKDSSPSVDLKPTDMD